MYPFHPMMMMNAGGGGFVIMRPHYHAPPQHNHALFMTPHGLVAVPTGYNVRIVVPTYPRYVERTPEPEPVRYIPIDSKAETYTSGGDCYTKAGGGGGFGSHSIYSYSHSYAASPSSKKPHDDEDDDFAKKVNDKKKEIEKEAKDKLPDELFAKKPVAGDKKAHVMKSAVPFGSASSSSSNSASSSSSSSSTEEHSKKTQVHHLKSAIPFGS